jgi:hypothetical protein
MIVIAARGLAVWYAYQILFTKGKHMDTYEIYTSKGEYLFRTIDVGVALGWMMWGFDVRELA